MRAQRLGVLQQLLGDGIDLELAAVEDLDEDLVLVDQRALDLLAQDRGVEEVLHADAEAADLVHVRRPDATARGADLGLAEEALGHLVECDVIRRDEVGARTDEQARGVDTACLEAGHLVQQHGRVDDHAVADDGDDSRGEDAAGEQVQGVLLVADDDGVSRVVAALVAHDVVHAPTEQVGGLALALIAPLSAKQHDCGHGDHLERRGGRAPWAQDGP